MLGPAKKIGGAVRVGASVSPHDAHSLAMALRELAHPSWTAQYEHICRTQGEDATGNHAGDVVDLRFKRSRIANVEVMDIQNDIAVVCGELFP